MATSSPPSQLWLPSLAAQLAESVLRDRSAPRQAYLKGSTLEKRSPELSLAGKSSLWADLLSGIGARSWREGRSFHSQGVRLPQLQAWTVGIFVQSLYHLSYYLLYVFL